MISYGSQDLLGDFFYRNFKQGNIILCYECYFILLWYSYYFLNLLIVCYVILYEKKKLKYVDKYIDQLDVSYLL